jgi:hypothetical protein
MGGLVVKKAYILGSREPEFKPVVDRVCSIFFLATPHQGAAIAQTLSRMAMFGLRPFVEDLFPGSPLILSISEDFPGACGGIQLFSFYETWPMNIGFDKLLIVEKSSAVMNLSNERRTFLDADHRNVAMYSSPDDPSYVSVRNALAAVISSQRDSSQLQRQARTHEEQDALGRFLGVPESPEGDLMVQESIKLPGSCGWLTNKTYYQSWKGSTDSSFLWLRGRPGAGKSVLASHVIGDLRNQGLDCCFFFFQARDNVKSTANGCLRSMAWQMAMLHPGIRDKLKAIMSTWRKSQIDETDSDSIWRTIFLAGILKFELDRRQFWVIDAMDECRRVADMLTFLTRIQEHWPVSIFVTSRDATDTYQKGGKPRNDILSYTISEQDNLQDISLLLKANLEHLPSGSDGWPTPEMMASQILERSRGCFLWASIVCSELLQVTSEREITEVVESTPSDMDAVYSGILAKMETARFGKATAKAIIAWVTYALRPLSVCEMQTPVEMDINDKIDDIHRAISRSCGSLVYVDQHETVRLVHLTAREFLTREEVKSSFTLTSGDGHRRLAVVCLKFLLQNFQTTAAKAKRLGRRPDTTKTGHGHPLSPQSSLQNQSPNPFTEYAATFCFEHLNNVDPNDEELIAPLSSFLTSNNLLCWIEYIATNGNLRTVYQAGQTMNSLMRRRTQHASPQGPSWHQGDLALLEKWGDDLIHLVTNFSGWLRRSPKAIHHLIPPFCPPDSAIRRQLTSPARGLNVQGLSSRGWDDCIATITYAKGIKPNTVAAGPGYFAVGMVNMAGHVLIYDDTIFQEIHTLYHGEPVWRLAFAENGRLLASSGGTTVRIWCSTDGTELSSFKVNSLCVSLRFVEEDTMLSMITSQSQFIEREIESTAPVRRQVAPWEADLPESMRGRVPALVKFSLTGHLVALLFRGENIVIWDCIENRIYDIYEKRKGSIHIFGSHMPRGSTTVAAAAFGRALDSDLFAAYYYDGDLVVYDVEKDEAIALAENACTSVLAASPDGRTLAGADSIGNFTLFEFKTLRPLYRVRFDTPGLPKALCFTSDSRRFIEIRGKQCRVWEPTVLLRDEMRNDDNSGALSLSAGPQEITHNIVRDQRGVLWNGGWLCVCLRLVWPGA